ncbi:MAG TPA: AraC family transcriptional regulator [Nocardioidaceae bacterium]|nr:AraC family transcriptional regulator [Nocardioidaceae bacterium]
MTSTGADTFVRFVDSLATNLDDHEARGEELAARMYLSRFHFDRVVSAVAGETPARFRRRVLLERAAYRLVTSGNGVLDVAVEAGYSSNEAFTRAFQRAYGEAPSVWRNSPTQIQLATPNGVHFQPPGSLRLPARTKVTPMELLTRMVEHHVWLIGQMIERAGRLRDEQLDAQIDVSVDEDRQSLRRLLSRLVGQMDMWNCAMANRPYDWSLEEHEAIPAMRARLGTVGPAFLAEVRQVVADGRLDDTFVDALCEPAEVFTYGGMVAHVLTFAAHNRTLVVLALKQAGITDLGWGDPMKWVAQPA